MSTLHKPETFDKLLTGQLVSAGVDDAGLTPDQIAMKRKAEYIALKEQELAIRDGLPFLYGWKWYKWAREFYESTNKINLLCAANQISKSSTQIRKALNWATNERLWPDLWRNRPTQFWYLYPTANQATIEFETKWVQFLPRGEYKDHPKYGWKAVYKNKEIFAIYFNSGVNLYFKTYAQDATALQTGTCDALFCDEELPVDLYEELIFRLSASDGYFHMVFTATLGQEFWRLAMDPGPTEKETLVGAFKQTISMYDCLKYEDGELSHWNLDKIKQVEARCSSESEILKRVHGKFIMEQGGRKYAAFDLKRHMKDGHPLPKDWLIYGGADVGSGGKGGHPSAIVFIAVAPDFRKGRVFIGWRGDGIPTTAGDVVTKFVELRNENKLVMTGQYYDHACRDFFEIASRMNEPFIPADKHVERGEQMLNVLFKNDMLFIYNTDELYKLGSELSVLRKDIPKNKAKDDFCDALRYAVTKIPWDWSVITGAADPDAKIPEKPKNNLEIEIAARRAAFVDTEKAAEEDMQNEFDEWNGAYGN